MNLDSCYKFKYLTANSADPDQLASSKANRSGFTLFAKANSKRYIFSKKDTFFRQIKRHYFSNFSINAIKITLS